MQKRDYVLLSGALKRAYHSNPELQQGVLAAAISIAHDIHLMKPTFDVQRFYHDIKS